MSRFSVLWAALALAVMTFVPAIAQVASPSPSPMPAPIFQGTLLSVAGGSAEIEFGNGTIQSVPIGADASTALIASLDKPIAFLLVNGTLKLAEDVLWGTLVSFDTGTATIRDAAQKTTTYATAASPAQLRGCIGKTVAFTLSGNTMTLASQQAPPANQASPRAAN